MVTNPRYTALAALLELAEEKRDSIAEALDEVHRLMSDRGVWTGPTTATQFGEDVEYRKNDLPGLADNLIEEIRDALSSTPEEVRRDELGHTGPL
ncbi:hypothetical protein [Phytoactinopolyspora halotolerans]|uniref:Uncharacterized protein n=1 Tax=Phytoactinopolyspora halotolerans TaxID=1981512 RepID=A0A6L9SFP2_9ACTN|nr:hypothetical protein [Phytoactinopolyspora halotolerans]NEE02880.1 hypothetical protein [Phytoactinopolyspora halotolerans]